jgi:hypothetical protein
MNSRKVGKLFIVLMISLVAFGFGSIANALDSGNGIISGILPSSFTSDNGQQISVIDDSSFKPVHVMRQFYNNTTNVTNSTNSTPVITNTTVNSTTNKKTVSGNGTKKGN